MTWSKSCSLVLWMPLRRTLPTQLTTPSRRPRSAAVDLTQSSTLPPSKASTMNTLSAPMAEPTASAFSGFRAARATRQPRAFSCLWGEGEDSGRGWDYSGTMRLTAMIYFDVNHHPSLYLPTSWPMPPVPPKMRNTGDTPDVVVVNLV